VDNSYSNGDGLVRIQPLTPKGTDHLYAAAAGTTEAKLWMDSQLSPVYMRITPTGHEVFGSLPAYYALDGGPMSEFGEALYIVNPLPTLPTKKVRPGDSWQSRFFNVRSDMADYQASGRLPELTRVSEKFPARGEFVSVEWEMGHPCAKIRNVIAQGTSSLEGKKLAAAGSQFSDEKIQLEEIIWFALDKRHVVKSVTNITIDMRTDGGGGGGRGAPGPGRGTRGGGPAGGDDGEIRFQDPQGRPPARGGRGNPGAPGLQGGGQGRAGGGMPGGEGRGAPAAAQWQRLRIQQIMVLEK
jgi:hypothetical protein